MVRLRTVGAYTSAVAKGSTPSMRYWFRTRYGYGPILIRIHVRPMFRLMVYPPFLCGNGIRRLRGISVFKHSSATISAIHAYTVNPFINGSPSHLMGNQHTKIYMWLLLWILFAPMWLLWLGLLLLAPFAPLGSICSSNGSVSSSWILPYWHQWQSVSNNTIFLKTRTGDRIGPPNKLGFKSELVKPGLVRSQWIGF